VKRRFANRCDWERVLESRFDVVLVDDANFKGHVTRLTLDRVREPLYRDIAGRRFCLADSGYCWLQHFPVGAFHTITTMVDATGVIVQRYIDICERHGIEGGIPWFDDLYLDIVVLPTGEMVLLDADELEVALETGEITRSQYDLAWSEASGLQAAIRRRAIPVLGLGVTEMLAPFRNTAFRGTS